MKKYFFIIIILASIALIAYSFKPQSSKLGPHLKYILENTGENDFIVYVYFNDKGPNALSVLSNPLNLVTQRSVKRRLKVKPPDRVVSITDVPVYRGYVDEIAPKVLSMRNQLKWLNAVSVELNRTQLNEISSLDFVKQIELVETFKSKKEEPLASNKINPVINDHPEADSLNYGLYGATQITLEKINMVHNQGIFGQGILIASLDDGFRNQTHPCFTNPANPMQIVSQYDFQLHLPGAYRTNGTHGTNTISVIGAYAPGNLIGVSFKSSFLVARTEVDSFERNIEMDNWIAAAQWADSLGADVITSSLIYLGFEQGQISYTWLDMNGNTMPITIGADIAADNGIAVFNCAGNDGLNTSHNTLEGPADGDSVITIGAINGSGIRASFSSVGPTTDNPPRIKPDLMAFGTNVQTASGSGTGYSYGSSSGTSFAAPIGAGVGALMLSVNKSLTPMQIRGILRKFGSNSNSPDNLMGWGVIDAQLSVDSARKLDTEPPMIIHTQPFTSTSDTGVITMKAVIKDNGIIRNWTNEAPLLYYRKSTNGGINWTAYTAVNYNYTNLDSFFFPISGNSPGTSVEYYFAAQDIALPVPLVSTLPAGGSGVNPPGTTPPPAGFIYNIVPIGIKSNSNEIPAVFRLYNNYPNPFNPLTRIKFDIPKTSFTKLIVFDILGREITSLVEQELKPGTYGVEWDASNYPSGVYFYKLISRDFTETKKMVLVK
jgi:serine protease AprX